ncbi:MAG: diguanylate cyclase [Nitrospira sp.]|nr:sensor domain-containing diguanylate cyclase [Candidatus Manganitrophaceae bacterium]HIL35058.1 sensor domain-containing diguanylate cyclase [Candidatus Manganitrophaceae bacterium]
MKAALDPSGTRTATRALIGMVILIVLFCAYVVHTRITFGNIRAVLQEQAFRDPLTDLYNRQYFNRRIGEEIARANRNKSNLGLLLCDLDHFKKVNDSKGHQAGDDILREVARVFKNSTRGTDLVFRWGGDEIVVILANATREGILITSERIRKGIQNIGKKIDLNLDISIGVAIHPEHVTNEDELICLADRALYIAKKGGDKIHIGEEEYELNEDAIDVVFQPIVNTKTNEILGHEALGRDPRGKQSIQEIFKKYHAIGKLRELKCLCFLKQLKQAEEVGLKKVFVNVEFDMLSHLEPTPKPPGMEVILEISESEAIYDVEFSLEIARKWRALGYKFAIDDFGAGFISLPFIAQFTPDYIKIDRSTMLQSVHSEKFRSFLKDLLVAIRNYTREEIIAEGVETEKELKAVKEMDISMVQGFLLGKPVSLGKMGNKDKVLQISGK